MRGGLERWKRGVGGRGVRHALAYALQGECDAKLHGGGHDHAQTLDFSAGVAAAEGYAADRTWRYVVTADGIDVDALDREQLRTWISGDDPVTGALRGRDNPSPDADLLLDATVNAPKSFSLAAVLDPELEREFESLQDRLRDRVMLMWREELNTRRGAGGTVKMDLAQIEVVELRHERSRALDPHKHRHLWLNIKVKGEDGKWSRLDSRVAMRFHTIVNAEGDLAARTDPQWVAALAAKGYTIDAASGEIAELAHLVRPLSRRSNQIEANRAARLAAWHDAHPGQEPSPRDLAAIDRWAWSYGRPDKPETLDEDQWADNVRAEIAAIDPAILRTRRPVTRRMGGDRDAPVTVTDLDRDLLAVRAIVDADGRSVPNGGRFSTWDVRAGAARAVAASGVVGDRDALTEVIEDVTARALTGHARALLDGDASQPHVKVFMAADTVTAKAELERNLAALATPGRELAPDTITAVAGRVLDDGQSLNTAQASAAAAIAGTDGLVAVTGPAGTGKTTMLRVATSALTGQDRKAIVLAPTKKAAAVAGRETGMDAASVHRFLLDHGWSAVTDTTGRTRWTHTPPGKTVPGHDHPYTGPRHWPLRHHDRLIIDEAGMLDADTARVLTSVAAQAGAGIAFIGDPRQVMPVGHGGAMELARRSAGRAVELDQVHRFLTGNPDPGPDGPRYIPNTRYAEVTLQMRAATDIEQAREVAGILVDGIDGARVAAATSTEDARQIAVDAYLQAATPREGRSQTVAIVTATNAEAQQINEAIQQRRVDTGQLDPARYAAGQDGQRLLAGDIVQTRRNNSELGVENRALWRITRIHRGGDITVTATDHTGVSRRLPRAYVASHAHLAYASTVHGIQGETVDRSIVLPGVDAAGMYVGMTRGRHENTIITLGQTRHAQIEEIASVLARSTADASLQDAIASARADHAAAARPAPTGAAPDRIADDAAWNDPAARPLGHIDDIDHAVTTAETHRTTAHKEAETAADRVRTLEQTLHEIQRRRHSAPEQHSGTFAALHATLATKLTAAREHLQQTRRRYQETSKVHDAAIQEQTHRGALPPDTLATERAQRAEQRRLPAPGPAPWNDQKTRPFGAVTRLDAKIAQTRERLDRARRAAHDAHENARALERELTQLEQDLATGHARRASPEILDYLHRQIDRLRHTRDASIDAANELHTKHRTAAWAFHQALDEEARRAAMPPVTLRDEDTARQEHHRTAHPVPGPARQSNGPRRLN